MALDGKLLRRWFGRASDKSALHMVSAWSCEQRLVLAQIAADAESNDMHCQYEASQRKSRGASHASALDREG